MKQKIKKIIANPKKSIGITLILAIAIGISFSAIQSKSRENMFSKNISNVEQNIIHGKDLTLAFPTGGRIKNVNVKIGESVKAGDVLASLDSENVIGAINQAKGAYTAAQNNYDKLVNGTSNTDIQIAKVALTNAKNNYANITSQQKISVENALLNFHNSGLTAIPTTNKINVTSSPVISGTYKNTEEGTYTIIVSPVGDGYNYSYSGLENGNGNASTIASPLGNRGLYIQFPYNFSVVSNNTWTVSVPNIQSPNYLNYYNAYQTALQNQTQAVAQAQGIIDSAQANLDQKISGTRSEDLEIAKAQVESTKGTLQIAEGNYKNTIITAPVDGTITNVSITEGQIATANTPAIELLSK